MELGRVTVLFNHMAHIDRQGLYGTTNDPTTTGLVPGQCSLLNDGNPDTCPGQSPRRDRTGWTAADHDDIIREAHVSLATLCNMK